MFGQIVLQRLAELQGFQFSGKTETVTYCYLSFLVESKTSATEIANFVWSTLFVSNVSILQGIGFICLLFVTRIRVHTFFIDFKEAAVAVRTKREVLPQDDSNG